MLAIDLGTTTGYAYTLINPDAPIDPPQLDLYLGQWDLSAGEYDSGALRFLKLRRFLAAVKPDLVLYEAVRNTPAMSSITKFNAHAIMARAATAAQLFGAFMSTVASWCEARNIPCTGIPIGTIKKRATQRGNASKEDVIIAANKLWGLEFDPATYEQTGVDNICDAAFCLLIGLESLADGFDNKTLHSAGCAAGAPARRQGHRADHTREAI